MIERNLVNVYDKDHVPPDGQDVCCLLVGVVETFSGSYNARLNRVVCYRSGKSVDFSTVLKWYSESNPFSEFYPHRLAS